MWVGQYLDIILALHCCECDIELTERVIDLNYTLRTLFTFASDRHIDKALEVACHTWLMTPLTTPTLTGNCAVYCHLLDPDTKKFVYSDVVRAFVMLMDLWQYEEGTWPGVALLINMTNVTLGHVAGVDLTVAQQFFYFLQEAMFIRLKEFHFINAPPFVDKLLSVLRPFMKPKMIDMLKVHAVGSDTLNQYLPIAALPKSDDCKALADEVWDKFKAHSHFYEDEALKRVDETKRPGGPITMSTIFPSIEGSFKNLVID
ncbi:hypothetical protein ACJJTC_011737 [Scirpophaga incertulas]